MGGRLIETAGMEQRLLRGNPFVTGCIHLGNTGICLAGRVLLSGQIYTGRDPALFWRVLDLRAQHICCSPASFLSQTALAAGRIWDMLWDYPPVCQRNRISQGGTDDFLSAAVDWNSV